MGLSTLSLSSQDKSTQVDDTIVEELFQVGASFNPVFYSADFRAFEGTTPCCGPYQDNLGFGFSLYGGKDLAKFELAGINSRYSLRLALDYSQAGWSDRYFVSHRNGVDGFDSIYSNNNLDISTFGLGLRNYVFLDLTENISVAPFLDVSFLASSSFDKSETVDPESDFLFENGQKSRINESGPISGLSVIQPSIGLNLSYKIFENTNLAIRPEAEVQAPLTDLVDNVDLSPIYFRIGVNVSFKERPEKTELPPPIPEPKQVPDAEPFVLSFDSIVPYLVYKGKDYKEGTDLFIEREISKKTYEYSILPRIFFSYTGKIIDTKYPQLSPGSETIKDQILTKSKSSVTQKLSLKSYHLPNQGFEPTVYLDKVAEELGIENSEYSFIIDTINDVPQYQELVDEFRRVEILDEGKEMLLPIKFSTEKIINAEEGNFKYITKAWPDSLSNRVATSLISGKGSFPMVLKNDYAGSFNIPEGKSSYAYKFITTDPFTESTIENTYTLSYRNKYYEVINGLTSKNGNEKTSQFILGYMDFDSDVFFAVDKSVVESTKKALGNGQKVTIVTSTDNLGDAEYNRKLALKRGENAKNLFSSKYDKQINIENPKGYQFDNEHPYGRIFNRAVFIRIEE
ncbi:MAG: hypothetical protein Kapaf2KO_22900 [Candidatus Kapaibacteriales bacterium]